MAVETGLEKPRPQTGAFSGYGGGSRLCGFVDVIRGRSARWFRKGRVQSHRRFSGGFVDYGARSTVRGVPVFFADTLAGARVRGSRRERSRATYGGICPLAEA